MSNEAPGSYRFEVMRTMSEDVGFQNMLTMGALGLTGEAGEVADLIKKHLFQGHPLDTEKLKKELGDVRWYMEALFIALHTDMKEIELMNIEKLQTRYPVKFEAARSIVKEE